MKTIIWIATIAIILGAIGYLAYRWYQTGSQFLPQSFEELQCVEAIAVSGNSMEPAIQSGSRLMFNKCIDDKDNIELGTIVEVQENGKKRLGRIKNKEVREDGIWYQISQDNRPDVEFTVSIDDIIAVQ